VDRRAIVLVLVTLAACSGGGEAVAPVKPCLASAAIAPGDTHRSLVVGGATRDYYVHVPSSAPPGAAAPLVLAFHGGGDTAMGFEGFVHLRGEADAAGFVLVEPEGTGALGPSTQGRADTWNAGNCCAASSETGVDDVAFVRAVLDDLEQATCIDTARVYATGFSNGGMLAHRLACELSDRIAAIAAVSGGLGATDLDVTPPATLFACRPTRPVPVLHVHGTGDACYPFEGGEGPVAGVTFEAVPTTIEGWLSREGCGQSTTTTLANGIARCTAYDCPPPGAVTLCTLQGGGHYWPGGGDWLGSETLCGPHQGVRSADLDANDVIWTWFAQHPRR
jgi:polyhydroxybutyrate depolymerase